MAGMWSSNLCVLNPRLALYHNYSAFHTFLGSPGPQPRPLPGPTPTSGMTARGLLAGSRCRSVAWLWVCSCPRPAADLKDSTSSAHLTPTVIKTRPSTRPDSRAQREGSGTPQAPALCAAVITGCHPSSFPAQPSLPSVPWG